MRAGLVSASWIDVSPYCSDSVIVRLKKSAISASLHGGTGMRSIALSTNMPGESVSNERSAH